MGHLLNICIELGVNFTVIFISLHLEELILVFNSIVLVIEFLIVLESSIFHLRIENIYYINMCIQSNILCSISGLVLIS